MMRAVALKIIPQYALVPELAYGIGLEPMVCEFDSHLGHLPVISKSFPTGVVMESLSLRLMVQILPAIKQ